MVDFLLITRRRTKTGTWEIYPKFIVKNSEDLMIRGKDFYAIWLEKKGIWSTNIQEAQNLIDDELDKYVEENKDKIGDDYRVLHIWDAENGMVDRWIKYVTKQMPENYHDLDDKLIFSNTPTSKTDYASKRLDYPLKAGDISAYNKLVSRLYSPEERRKFEWAIGAVINGASKKIQKFLVFYGAGGTGKSTIIDIIEKQLFKGYCTSFNAKALTSASNSFPLEDFRNNPLVAVQHDGKLSKIEDNTILNSLVSHEAMSINVKYHSSYVSSFKCFLFMGTNEPVKITDAKSGLLRRLIDVSPTGNLFDIDEYNKLKEQIKFELGGIAWHCKEVYESDPHIYDGYIPTSMLSASNDFYNFVMDSYPVFEKENGTTLKAAWEMYKVYCDDAKVPFPYSQRAFKEELKNYFDEYTERYCIGDGTRVRNYYSGFIKEKFLNKSQNNSRQIEKSKSWIELKEQHSKLDDFLADCPAQYANEDEKPIRKWENVKTKLSELKTNMLHYVLPPEILVCIDFDLKDETGKKSRVKNLEKASEWLPTYAELSKSGEALHLYYIYKGDVNDLSRIFDENIEVKVFTGKSSLRRKVTLCNDLDISEISSGLPFKKEKIKPKTEGFTSQKTLEKMIERNLSKDIHDNTTQSVNFIAKLLEEAYDSGKSYDVSEYKKRVEDFAEKSTNQADICKKTVSKMHFMSKDKEEEMLSAQSFDADKRLRYQIVRALDKKIALPNKYTNSNSHDDSDVDRMEYVNSILQEAYETGEKYDVENLRNGVITFAASSLKQSTECMDILAKMHFKSDERSLNKGDATGEIAFFDVEVYPNMWLLCWKLAGENHPVIQKFNPTPDEIVSLLNYKLIGFNCRRYDNHILYAAMLGASNEAIYRLSQNIIQNGKGFYSEAYNLSYTDIFDFSSKKQSLKKFEIELGIHHQEMGIPWDEPVPKELWSDVAEYCENDVIATEAVFNARKADFTAREILASLAELTVNDTTNTLTTRIIFGKNRTPQSQFNYRNLALPVRSI